MSRVALVRCADYEPARVRQAVQHGLDLLGGAKFFVAPGENILLKPNLLTAEKPEKCVTTHPSVFKAVASVFQEAQAILSYGDSPAFESPQKVARKTGIMGAAEELAIPLADFQTGVEVSYSAGRQNKRFTIARGALDTQGIISLPKLKTHGLARMTGCVKNQFGCVPGLLKGEFHVKLSNVNDFARMLVDLNLLLKPRLYIMDGIIAMEGNGPRGGNPRKMGVLLFSADPIALDATVCRMIDLDPSLVPTILLGHEAGLGKYSEQEVELVGDPLDEFIVNDFDVRRESLRAFRSSGLFRLIKNALVPKPFIIKEKCRKCGICTQICPVDPKAVDWHNGDRNSFPSFKYDRCIRCYCCQELCPESAIELKTNLIRHFLS